jgi:hypothetical protein
MVERHSALVQVKELTDAFTKMKDRVELCELQNADLAKKLEIMEHIIIMPDEDKPEQVALQAVTSRIAEVEAEVRAMRSNQSSSGLSVEQ